MAAVIDIVINFFFNLAGRKREEARTKREIVFLLFPDIIADVKDTWSIYEKYFDYRHKEVVWFPKIQELHHNGLLRSIKRVDEHIYLNLERIINEIIPELNVLNKEAKWWWDEDWYPTAMWRKVCNLVGFKIRAPDYMVDSPDLFYPADDDIIFKWSEDKGKPIWKKIVSQSIEQHLLFKFDNIPEGCMMSDEHADFLLKAAWDNVYNDYETWAEAMNKALRIFHSPTDDDQWFNDIHSLEEVLADLHTYFHIIFEIAEEMIKFHSIYGPFLEIHIVNRMTTEFEK
jgi:hypothetical protein